MTDHRLPVISVIVKTAVAKPFELEIPAPTDASIAWLTGKAEAMFGLTGRFQLMYLVHDGYRLDPSEAIGDRREFRLVAEL